MGHGDYGQQNAMWGAVAKWLGCEVECTRGRGKMIVVLGRDMGYKRGSAGPSLLRCK